MKVQTATGAIARPYSDVMLLSTLRNQLRGFAYAAGLDTGDWDEDNAIILALLWPTTTAVPKTSGARPLVDKVVHFRQEVLQSHIAAISVFLYQFLMDTNGAVEANNYRIKTDSVGVDYAALTANARRVLGCLSQMVFDGP